MKRKITVIIIISAFILTGFIACRKKDNSNSKPEFLKYYDLFSTSVFHNKIDSVPVIDPNSDVMVESLIEQKQNKGFLIGVKEWTVPVYYADASTKKYNVRLTASWAPMNKMLNVPIPEFAEPDHEQDASMVIIDENNGCIYDFWEMRYSLTGKWTAGWGNALPLNGDGIFPKGLSARGSGFELLQGVIWPQELEAGVINHALIFSYDHTKAGGPVWPATESDGTTTDPWGIPEGALVQLDPTLDLSTLGLNNYELVIAKALQDYGMYCADDGGGIQLYAINPVSCKTNPYENIWGDKTNVSLDKIPVEKFRIIKLPEQSETEPQLVNNSCAVFK